MRAFQPKWTIFTEASWASSSMSWILDDAHAAELRDRKRRDISLYWRATRHQLYLFFPVPRIPGRTPDAARRQPW
eukprot:471713-Hanusia_phi.AAC.1